MTGEPVGGRASDRDEWKERAERAEMTNRLLAPEWTPGEMTARGVLAALFCALGGELPAKPSDVLEWALGRIEELVERAERASVEVDQARVLLYECYVEAGAEVGLSDPDDLWPHATVAVRELRQDYEEAIGAPSILKPRAADEKENTMWSRGRSLRVLREDS
jgi:hypothetical protein